MVVPDGIAAQDAAGALTTDPLNKFYSILFVTVGAVLIYVGIDSIPWLLPPLVRFFPAPPSAVAIWPLLAGIGIAAAGLYRAWRDRSRFD